ncbi:MAG: DNA translocase FtsK [Patescibacteria group bacterium]
MAKKNGKKPQATLKEGHRLHPQTKKSVWAIVFVGLAVLFILAGLHAAGPAGNFLYAVLDRLLGWGYFVLPLSLIVVAGVFLISERQRMVSMTLLGAVGLVLSVLGLIDIFSPGSGGWLGLTLGFLKVPFGKVAGGVLNSVIFIASLLITLNAPIRIKLPERAPKKEEAPAPVVTGESKKEGEAEAEEESAKEPEEAKVRTVIPAFLKSKKVVLPKFKDYVPPPLDLLKSSTEKPTTGDLRANANIIKRTLESFGVVVEMGEINIGPKVTRYTLKPAEGMKLSRITALNQDLALALAAHPIRIEAPIPGKSLVGIEVPNKAAAVVRLGSLMSYPDFAAAGLLGFVLGRDVTGEPLFTSIEKMPHLLIAGATGSGKSILIHSLLISLLYKNSPATLKLILIDPKRVELSVYENIPHLVSPVITESKKTIGVFRWAINEMERRYDLLQRAGSRDITSYNQNGGKDNPLPFLLIVVDELADLMASYGREVEGSIVRLAQMSRATGLHLVLSTQRPSVEVITGLIKANITSRIALQVASQIDSRTILDASGAEKLLGGGDLLFMSSELSKPKRIQGAYISEEEIRKVADFIRENNQVSYEEFSFTEGENGAPPGLFDFTEASGDDDELLIHAIDVVCQAKKASASLLQRRLKVGYARAARLLDLMEERGIIGPGEGAKPREVYLDKQPDFNG